MAKITECNLCKEVKQILAKGLCRQCYNRESYRKLNPGAYKKKELTLQSPEEKRERRRVNSYRSRCIRKYGITYEQYAEILKGQNGRCLGCGAAVPLDIDHDHKNGKVRWLLCRPCNLLLGQIEKKPDAVGNLTDLLYLWELQKVFDTVRDSGSREEFSTGSVRDTRVGKGRFDLISTIALRRLAQHYANGAEKYTPRNWEKGQPLGRYLDSAMRHLVALLECSHDEDHAAAVAWNAFAFIHTSEKILDGTLPKELDDIGFLNALMPQPGGTSTLISSQISQLTCSSLS